MLLGQVPQVLVLVLVLVALAAARVARLRWRAVRGARGGAAGGRRTVGVLHPYCNAGGGGERVLWFAVQSLLELDGGVAVHVYARRSAGEPAAILARARARFGLGEAALDATRIHFVRLSSERLLEAETFPRLTLLGQSLGSMAVGAEALWRFCPDVFLDTMGYAFTYPLAWLCGCRVACYTHYPTISTDMLQRVYEQRPAYNNDALVSGSAVNSRAKYWYYRAFCVLYWAVGLFPEVVLVNSNWTRAHIASLWPASARPAVLFPPCDTKDFTLGQKKRKARIIVSLGQFRPEKDHRLQIQALKALKAVEALKATRAGGEARELPRLVMFGSCRDAGDEARVAELRSFAAASGVLGLVDFRLNEPFGAVKDGLAGALLGVHSMWNEHFGIAPVEMMAAGVILVAHNSGGPKVDIIEHAESGFLATSADEYAECFARVLDLYDEHGGDDCQDLARMREKAIASVQRFSQEHFCQQFTSAMAPIVLLPPGGAPITINAK